MEKKKNQNWTREETILAFNQYCKMPFGKMHSRNPEVIHLSEILGRTPSAVAMKLTNLARLDPSLQERNVGGMANGSKMDEIIWNEFQGNWETLAFESERLLAQYSNKQLSDKESIGEIAPDFDYPQREGTERETLTRIRVNQQFFRKMVLVAYESSCCVTGINHDRLLIASHIKPWAKFPDVRVNPYNGLCLNALHDRAFDSGLMTILPDYRIRFSSQLNKMEGEAKWMTSFDNKCIKTPERFLPNKTFLEYHNDCVFLK